ncbi:MAG: glycosyltransferase family 2 protein [Candidatus Methylomirabilis oxygeniifera]|uniref:Putative Glycosyl transferase family 2 n=1 Tax=Methylomirabilis oxygeniifera TaxID=671143 RepID=D5MJ22_METO1|nr:MAG: glycosyltransferase family 2 protein [Candidatus Methylomirabilis oxyfera]CBE67387.1 putative Glycosyl transferase family 2 precursor [Candidatus Methylomirabilis oxyfera]
MMQTLKPPLVSVVIVNYNGLHFLGPCLTSLERLHYPRERYEVILVDNASSDGSIPYVRTQFPWVTIVRNAANLGFAGGNNAGIRAAKGAYLALLNNDTRVDRDWLAALVEVCEADPLVGACTSKILLMKDRLRLRLETDAFTPSGLGVSADSRELGVIVEQAAVRSGDAARPVDFVEGFYGEELVGERRYRWSSGRAILGLPISPDDRALSLVLSVSNPRPSGAPTAPVSLWVGEERIAQFDAAFEPRTYEVPLAEAILRQARQVIQNAGSLLLPDGSGRDRGALVRNGQQSFEENHGQYDRTEEVFALCGAAVLLRRTMLDDVGLLDDEFFMYYEDTDLAWRARLRGWKIMYAPGAVVRHVHCGSSIEWSPLFTFHVLRNRLAMLLKDAPAGMAAREWRQFLLSLLIQGMKLSAHCARGGGRRVTPLWQDVGVRARVARSLMMSLPGLYRKRRTIRGAARVGDEAIMRWICDPDRTVYPSRSKKIT